MSRLLTLAGVDRAFGQGTTRILANRNINLSVNTGEKVLMIGPSGSGKTTLLLMIGCLLAPSAGTITFSSRELSSLNDTELTLLRLSSIGFIFQSFNLLPMLTAWENVMLPALLAGERYHAAKGKAQELLASLGLEHRLRNLPQDLSGGEKQRAAVARALINNPSLILADEPTANLDSVNGRAVIRLICENIRPESGRALIVASHDQRLLPFVDRIITLEDGQVKNDQRPSLDKS